MASVQTSPAVQQPVGSMPAQSPNNLKESLQRYKQMKEAGVSEKDPEFQKLHSMLTNMQQQRIFQQQRAQQMAQQQQLNQQQSTTSASMNNANGVRTAPAANPQMPNTSSLGPSALSATANPSAPKTNIQRAVASGTGNFSAEQLSLLKHQIYAFKCLSKNIGIPQATQQQLFVQQKKLQQASETSATAGPSTDDTQPITNGADAADGEKTDGVGKKQHEYTGFKPPHALLQKTIS